jgi:hypothetical protein
MGDQRRHLAAEQPIDQPGGFLRGIIVARHGRPVEVAAAVLLMVEHALGEQPPEHRLDGGHAPAALSRHALGDFGGRERCRVPQHLHHRIFGLANPFHAAAPRFDYLRNRAT